MLNRLNGAGLKVHIKKSTFGASSVDYLGYVITRDGLRPQQKRIKVILDLAVPRNVREVRRILGIIGYYRDLWPERSRTLAPLYELVRTENDGTKNKNKKEAKKNNLAKVVWTYIHETAFSTMKMIVAREALLAYPDFERPFIIHMDACDIQLGSAIIQNKNQ